VSLESATLDSPHVAQRRTGVLEATKILFPCVGEWRWPGRSPLSKSWKWRWRSPRTSPAA